jgi:hypothetical protein
VRPYLEKQTSQKIRAGGVAHGEGPEFKRQNQENNDGDDDDDLGTGGLHL